MYNRYVRNDRGVYTRIPQDDPHPLPQTSPPSHRPEEHSHTGHPPSPPGHPGRPEGEVSFSYQQESPPNHEPHQSPPNHTAQQKPPHPAHHPGSFPGHSPPSDALRNLLNRFHLENVDTGDLLLLLLLFLLFKEDADEELLFALGLLLIL